MTFLKIEIDQLDKNQTDKLFLKEHRPGHVLMQISRARQDKPKQK